MAIKYLGETLDIHAGGVDLIFPASRERDRAIGIAHRQAVLALLAARRVPDGGRAEDVEVAGQLLYAPRPAGQGPHARSRSATCWRRCRIASKLNFTMDGLKVGGDRDRAPAQFQTAPGDRPLRRRRSTSSWRQRTAEALEALSTTSLNDDLNTAEALAAVFEYVRDANSAMDAGEFRAGNAPPRWNFSDGSIPSSTCCEPQREGGVTVRRRDRSADRGAHGGQEGAATSRAPTRSGRSCWSRASSWKTPRAACAGRGSRLKIHTKAVHVGRPQESRRPHSRHHTDPYGDQLLLRVDGSSSTASSARRRRATATRATTIPRPRRSKN